jgi:hypothetical protein
MFFGMLISTIAFLRYLRLLFECTLHQRRGLESIPTTEIPIFLIAAPLHRYNPAELLFVKETRSCLVGLIVRWKYTLCVTNSCISAEIIVHHLIYFLS